MAMGTPRYSIHPVAFRDEARLGATIPLVRSSPYINIQLQQALVKGVSTSAVHERNTARALARILTGAQTPRLQPAEPGRGTGLADGSRNGALALRRGPMAFLPTPNWAMTSMIQVTWIALEGGKRPRLVQPSVPPCVFLYTFLPLGSLVFATLDAGFTYVPKIPYTDAETQRMNGQCSVGSRRVCRDGRDKAGHFATKSPFF